MAKITKGKLTSDSSLKRLALIMAVNCVRNTVIEDYHARGSLSQEDMKIFNKQVTNKLYTFLRFLFNGSPDEREALLKAAGLLYPPNWDQPLVDADIKGAVKLLIKKPEIFEDISSLSIADVKKEWKKKGCRPWSEAERELEESVSQREGA